MKTIKILAGVFGIAVFSSNLMAAAPGTPPGVVCTPYVVNGQTTMRCISGTPRTYVSPPAPVLTPLGGPITPVNPPAPPTPVGIVPPPPLPPTGEIPVDLSHNIPGSAMCEVPGQPPSPGRGPGPCGSTPIAVSGADYNCSLNRSPASPITQAFYYVLENYEEGSVRLGNSILFGMPANSAMIFKFKTGNFNTFPRYGNVAFGDQYNRGRMADSTFMVLSERMCDFDISKIGAYSDINSNYGCYAMIGNSGALQMITAPGARPDGSPACAVKPNTTYYLSIRHDKPTPNEPTFRTFSNSCTSAICGQYISIR